MLLESLKTRDAIYKDYTSGKNILIRGERYSGKTDYILSLASTIAEREYDTKIAIVVGGINLEPYIEYFKDNNNININDNTIEYPNKSIIFLTRDINDLSELMFKYIMLDDASQYLDICGLMVSYVCMISNETPSLLMSYNFFHENTTIQRLENLSTNPRQHGKRKGDYILYDII